MARPKDKTPNYCGADKRSGEGTCTRGAGWGTDHPGLGHCKLHGGSTPNGIMFAAQMEVAVMGAPIDIEPHEALLTCVRIAAGEVAYSTRMIEGLKHDEAVGRLMESSEKTYSTDSGEVTYFEDRDKGPELHIWIRVRQKCVGELAKYSKMAIDAGVEERRVALAERWGDQLALVLQGILNDLRLTPAQRKSAPEIVRNNLAVLEGQGVMIG